MAEQHGNHDLQSLAVVKPIDIKTVECTYATESSFFDLGGILQGDAA